MTKTAVIGAGLMGSGIAQSLAQAGCEAACYDISEAQLEQARRLTVDGRFGIERAVERGKLSRQEADEAIGRLRFTASFDEALAGASVVIEAIPEDLTLKIPLFTRLDAQAPPDAILASNASGIPISALAAATGRPELVIGWHWASPAVVMKFAEIVVTERTAATTTAAISELARRCGKNPVVVKENPFVWGHAANRIVAALFREARLVVGEGLVDEQGLDRLMVDGFGWPVGPFAMSQGAVEGWGDGHSSSIGSTAGNV